MVAIDTNDEDGQREILRRTLLVRAFDDGAGDLPRARGEPTGADR